MDPRQISIQKLKEAREMVTITKQRRHIFLVETKQTLIEDLQSGLRLEPFQPHGLHCMLGLRESLCLQNDPTINWQL